MKENFSGLQRIWQNNRGLQPEQRIKMQYCKTDEMTDDQNPPTEKGRFKSREKLWPRGLE